MPPGKAWLGSRAAASLRTWLYRGRDQPLSRPAATTLRRPAPSQRVGRARIEQPEPTRLGEVVWLEPYPDGIA